MEDRGEESFIKFPKFAARLYDKIMTFTPMEIQRIQIAEIILETIKQGKLLDIGTGHGRLLLEISKLNPKLELYGIDISENMIELARENLSNINVDLRQGNINHTDFDDDFFDIITCTGSFYLWNAPIEGLNEIYRILKPNKIGILFETHKEYDILDLDNKIKSNLLNEGFFARRLVPRFLKKQLKMTYEISELNDILTKSMFGKRFSIEKVTLANLPIWIKIILKKE